MTVVNPHIMKVIAAQRITDLHREAVPRPEPRPQAKRTLRMGQSARRARNVSPVRAK